MLLIGIGNDDRGDDVIGQWVAHQIDSHSSEIRVVTGRGETVDLLDWWTGESDVVVVDAVSSGAEPGTVIRIDAHDEPLPSEAFRGSTHAFGLAEAVELGRAMDELPQRLIIFGIEGKSFDAGSGVSSEVRAAGESLVETLLEEYTDA